MLKTISIAERDRIMRFLIAGGLAALIEYCVFLAASFTLLKGEIYFANSVGFLSGLLVSYLLSKYWVFKSKKKGRGEFGHYFLLAMINLLVSNLLIGLLTSGISLSPFIAKLVAMAVIATSNYFIFSRLIFKPAPLM